MAGPRAPRTDTDQLASALDQLKGSQEALKAINLRHYRGNDELRNMIQESRNAVEAGIEWVADALDEALEAAAEQLAAAS